MEPTLTFPGSFMPGDMLYPVGWNSTPSARRAVQVLLVEYSSSSPL